MKFKSDKQRKFVMNMFSRGNNKFALYYDDTAKRVRSDEYPQVNLKIKPLSGDSIESEVKNLNKFESYLQRLKSIDFKDLNKRRRLGSYTRDFTEDIYDDSLDEKTLDSLTRSYLNFQSVNNNNLNFKNLPRIVTKKIKVDNIIDKYTGEPIYINKNKINDAILAHELGHHLDIQIKSVPFNDVIGFNPNDEFAADYIAEKIMPNYYNIGLGILPKKVGKDLFGQEDYAIVLNEYRNPTFKEQVKYANIKLEDEI